MSHAIKDVLDYLTPFVVRAGDYAAEIQGRVGHQPSKEEHANAFGQALTDADLSIQGFIEVALLAKFPEVSFWGEEEASSLNMKYFRSDGELFILLDPVDGTLFYRDNNDGYQVILTVCNRQSVLGALCYMPRSKMLFRAEKDSGLFAYSRETALAGGQGEKVVLNTSGNMVITFDYPEMPNLLGPGFDILDVKERYDPAKPCINMSSILLGKCSAIVFKSAGLIDYGALAFMVCEAGGVLSDFEGRAQPFPKLGGYAKYSAPVLCTSPELHARIIERLKGRS